MNNNKHMKNLILAGIAIIAPFQITTAAEYNIIVVNDRGKVLLLDNSIAEPRLQPVQSASFPYRVVIAAHFVASYGKLLLRSDNLQSYELDLNNLDTGYLQISSGCSQGTSTIDMPNFTWFDRRHGRPAGLCFGSKTNNFVSTMWFQDVDGQLRQSNPDDIEFPSGFSFSGHFDKKKPSSFFSDDLQQKLSHEVRAAGEWVINGRSRNITVYGLIIAKSTKDGEQFKSTKVFQNRIKNKWYLFKLDEAGDVVVYDSAATVRGMFDIKGDREPNNGNLIQQKPTGNWYFFSPFKEGFFKLSLNPSWVAYYATADEAFFAGDGKLMSIALWGERNPKPKILAELPDGFSVVAICPFTAPSQTNATPPAAKTRTL